MFQRCIIIYILIIVMHRRLNFQLAVSLNGSERNCSTSLKARRTTALARERGELMLGRVRKPALLRALVRCPNLTGLRTSK